MNDPVVLYDTTLRDGAQQEGISLTVEDKLKIVARLDALGIHVVEGGWPGSNPKDIEFFHRAAELSLAHARVSAFGATCRPGVDAADDVGLRDLVEADTPVVCLVGKAHDLHVTEALGTTLDENLRMVGDSVALVRRAGRDVVFDAEHFFDGYGRDVGYALDVLEAALDGGAGTLVLCDTNGGTLPREAARVVAEVKAALPVARLGVHFHNDADCAVANTLASVEAGAVHVQGTANGIGERCGNANLISIIANLKLKMGIACVTDEQLAELSATAHAIAEICNLTPHAHAPYVGASAFATKAGLHTSGLAKLSGAYEHVDPALVGNVGRLLVSELAGRSTIVLKAQEIGLELGGRADLAAAILDEVKGLEHAGYHFEAADASLELLMRRKAGLQREIFALESFRVIVEKREDGAVVSEATVKIRVRGERHIATAEGDGPVHALDRALRQALARTFPALDAIELVDYKVRILEEKKGTGAVTRVLLESSDGVQEWSTIGVSPNIIEASWQALTDSLTYGLGRSGEPG